MFRSSKGTKIRQREVLAKSFETASELTATQLQRLVTEAEVTLVILNRLDASQDTLHEMILMEKRVVDRDRDELVRHLILDLPIIADIRTMHRWLNSGPYLGRTAMKGRCSTRTAIY